MTLVATGVPARAEKPVEIKYSRQELEGKWRAAIRSFLDKGVIPIIDLESSLKRLDGEGYLVAAIEVMDELGVAIRLVDENKQFVEGWKKVIEDFQTISSSAWIHRQNPRTLLTMTDEPAKFAPHSVG